MKKKKLLILIILFSFISLTLSGCSQLFGWKYDTEELVVGMSQSEVEDVWGDPSSVYISGNYTLWDYTKLHNDGAYESYCECQIIFYTFR